MLEFVDLEVARAARGVRMVTPGNVASPWSEAAKGLFRVVGIPVLVSRFDRKDEAQRAWTHAHNVPVVVFDDDPPRTVWSQILALAVRLGPAGALVPVELDRRLAVIGMLHEIAGEDGLGWNARQGTRSFQLRHHAARCHCSGVLPLHVAERHLFCVRNQRKGRP